MAELAERVIMAALMVIPGPDGTVTFVRQDRQSASLKTLVKFSGCGNVPDLSGRTSQPLNQDGA
jgi:hypothetical protein